MIVDNALYRRGQRVDCGAEAGDLAGVRAQATGADDFVWVGLHEPTSEELDAVASLYDLHPLAVEDALVAHQRPKLERYDDSLFLVLKTLWYVDKTDQVETGEIALFVGPKFVVSVRHGRGAALHDARIQLEGMTNVLQHGPSAVVYAVCDTVVDTYEGVSEELVVDVDEVEAAVFSTTRTNEAERIYVLKRELAEMRRAVLPLREPLVRMAAGSVHGIDREAGPYFRDVADHVSKVAEIVDSLDSLLSAAFDAHMAQISMQQNDDMRKISAWVAIAAVPTMATGFYGMNFDHLPLLHQPVGLPVMLVLTVAACAFLFRSFKRAGWL